MKFISVLVFLFASTSWGEEFDTSFARVNSGYVRCSSVNYQYKTCTLRGRISRIRLTNQHSRVRCIRGRTWNASGRTIWVDNGCRATFWVETIN